MSYLFKNSVAEPPTCCLPGLPELFKLLKVSVRE